ncbi:aspartate dehydrogenase [Oceaniglobus ichthyenteri]|uniref:aspartate dehydrogenase n=1 Tax=Oceaniglobus ichthyenteri TaxID=2136177 RepID=UPI000D360B83|nr:aspartate dehydrogenase [Oceaniglobus ichthyenteri]
MSPRHLGLIGFGAIGRTLLTALCDSTQGAPERVTILARPASAQRVRAAFDAIDGLANCALTIVTDTNALMGARPDVVVECAGQQALAGFGAEIVGNGVDLIVASVGALADDALFMGLQQAAKTGRAQVFIPSGAIGGIDALAAARLSGIVSVKYTGRKPAHAWKGTPAENVLDLNTLAEATVFFTGTAREAARQYPKNANVAATLALAGAGMDATQVHLIADPAVSTNSHEFSVLSNAVDFTMHLTGKPSPDNPKTSMSTAYSLARAVLNRSETFVI